MTRIASSRNPRRRVVATQGSVQVNKAAMKRPSGQVSSIDTEPGVVSLIEQFGRGANRGRSRCCQTPIAGTCRHTVGGRPRCLDESSCCGE